MKYRKKPVVIEAMQWDGLPDTAVEIFEWCPTAEMRSDDRDTIVIPTLEGRMKASVGDWIIQGVKGEFYPCKPDIFEATYEAVES